MSSKSERRRAGPPVKWQDDEHLRLGRRRSQKRRKNTSWVWLVSFCLFLVIKVINSSMWSPPVFTPVCAWARARGPVCTRACVCCINEAASLVWQGFMDGAEIKGRSICGRIREENVWPPFQLLLPNILFTLLSFISSFFYFVASSNHLYSHLYTKKISFLSRVGFKMWSHVKWTIHHIQYESQTV